LALPSYSIIVPNYNGGEIIGRALEKLVASGALAGGQVCVVDDASSDDSVTSIRRDYPEVAIIERSSNGGFSAAANDGIRATEGEFVVLLNNDVEVPSGFLEPIMPLFEDSAVFAVTPSVLLPSRGNLDEGAKTGFWRHGMFYSDQRQGVTVVSPVLYASGCAAVYRREMLEALGGFDEAYSPFYWEDADLGYRAWKRGWKTLYQPAVSVRHRHSASTSRLDPLYTASVKTRNGLFFVWRNIEDPDLLARHRRWLPLVLARRLLARDRAFVRGFFQARARAGEARAACIVDSAHRVLSDREIFALAEVGV